MKKLLCFCLCLGILTAALLAFGVSAAEISDDAALAETQDAAPAAISGEPIIWRFNNQQVADMWKSQSSSFNKAAPTIVDDVMHTTFDSSAAVDDHDLQGLSGDNTFRLEDYPYIKFKVRHSVAGGLAMQFYIYSDQNTGDPRHQTDVYPPNVWTTFTGDYSDGHDLLTAKPYKGTVNRLRFWFITGNKTGTSDVEYIAFFPNTPEGRAAWEDFDSKNPTVTGSSDEYLPDYAAVKAAFKTLQASFAEPDPSIANKDQAQTKLEEAIAEVSAELSPDDSKLEYVGENKNGYEFKVTLAKGSINARSIITENITVKSKDLDPIIWRFNNDEVAKMWVNSSSRNGVFRKEDPTIVDGVAHTVYDSEQQVDNFDFALPVDKQFNLNDYPYFKAKIRFNIGSVNGMNVQLYVNNNETYCAYTPKIAQGWETVALNLKDSLNNPVTDPVEFLRFWRWTYYTTASSDIEYIAFFSNEEEWKAFDSQNPSVTGSSDAYLPDYPEVNGVMSVVENAFADVDKSIADRQQAEERFTQALETALEGTELDDHSYEYVGENDTGFEFRLTLKKGSKPEATTILTRSITVKNKYLKAKIWRFNDQSVADTWNKTSKTFNPNKSEIIDGLMHTEFSTSSLVDDHECDVKDAYEKFNLEDYPYFKIKFKYEGTASHLQLYLNNSVTNDNTLRYDSYNLNPNTWITYSVDNVMNGFASPATGKPYKGTTSQLRFWIWNDENTGSSDIEYIAFFADPDEYRNFDSAEPTVAKSSDKYLPDYPTARAAMDSLIDQVYTPDKTMETKELAQQKLQQAFDQIVSEYGLENGAVAYVGEDECGFEFKVSYEIGELPARTKFSENVVVRNRYRSPLIWRFNNDEVVKMWLTHSSTGEVYRKQDPVIIDGVAHTEYASPTIVDSLDYELPPEKEFNIADYPYFKAKYRFTDSSIDEIQLYINGNYHSYGTGNVPASNGQWQVTAWDFKDQLTFNNATTASDIGRVDYMRFWRWNHDKTGNGDIEYIAFFEDKDEWEAFDSQNPSVTGSSDAYLPDYPVVKAILDQIEAEFGTVHADCTTQELAQAALQQALDTAKGDTELYDSKIEFVNQTSTGFAFKLTLSKGEPETRTILTEIINVDNVKAESVVWTFTSPEFVSKWSVPGSTTAAWNQEGYITLTGSDGVDQSNMTYKIPDEQDYVDLDKYPVISIKYRSTHSGTLQLYPMTTTSRNTGATDQFYYQKSMPETVNQWTTLTWNVLNDSDVHNAVQGTWNDKLKQLRVDFMRQAKVKKDVDVAYIGFFSSVEEAQAYEMSAKGDQDIVDRAMGEFDDAEFTKLYADVNDEATAKAKIESLVQALELPEGVRAYVEPVGYAATDPELQDGMVGKYEFKLYFINGPVTSAAAAGQLITLPLAPKPDWKLNGAQIRTQAPQGLRFGTTLQKSFWQDKDVTDVIYGTVVIPEIMIPDEGELTLETESAADVVGENIYSEDETQLVYTAVVINIPDDMLNVKLAARPYIKYTIAGTQYIIYSSEIKICSVNDIKALVGNG